MTAQVWIAALVGIAAIIDDLSRRRIANWIPCTAFAAGMVLQSLQSGWKGAGFALLGTITGGAVFLLFYLLGGMGGGDVKLMAGFGAVLGVHQLLEAALWTAGCGGIMAVLVIAGRSARKLWMQAKGASPETDSEKSDSIPYAPAIAAGVWLSLVPKA